MTPQDRPLAVVTGASQGIGLELARQFARHGHDLLLCARGDELKQAAAELRTEGAGVETVRADLATGDGVEALVATVEGTGRPVEALAINAGVGAGGDFARDVPLERVLETVDLNVRSSVHLARRLVPGMIERGRGRILFTSSISSTLPAPYEAVYGASKAFVQSFARALRTELRDTGVTVTSLMPGPTETAFFRRAEMLTTKIGVGPKDDPTEVAREGYEALVAGRAQIVPGSPKNRAQAAAARVLPDVAKAWMHRRRAEPGTAG
ncbi:SDR family NAD(P)-dependent oxidoreductase [Patulibacter sp. S7RM1-6]